MSPDAIVIGGGLLGASAALHLSLHRLHVVVLERAAVARHASGASAGGVRTLGRDMAEVPLSLASVEMWKSIEALVDDDCGFRAHGQIRAAETEAELAVLAKRRSEMQQRGYDHEVMIDQAELRRRVPSISPHCVGALMVATDGAADPYRTTHAFRRKAERLGAIFHEGEGVAAIGRSGTSWRVATPRDHYDTPIIVNCAGAWADQIAAIIGDEAPITARCSMMMVTERLPPFLEPVISAVGRKLSFKQAPNGTVLIGGGQQGRPDRLRESYELDISRLAMSALAATALFPIVQSVRVVRTWAGLEAQTPDGIPIIGPSPGAPGVYHAFGFSGHGFQLGPVVGSAIADLITSGATNLPIAPFSLDRFSRSKEAA